MAVLIATALILYRFSIALPFFPPFLKYDPSEVPIMVGALTFGPLAGVALELVKNLIHALAQGGGNPIGFVANFAAGCLLIVPATVVYRVRGGGYRRWLAVVAGAGAMALGMIFLNSYVFLPAHGIKPSAATVMAVSTLTPFNVVKGLINAGLGVLLYERLAFVLRQPAGYRDGRM